jgi:hypothetical protein
MKSNIFTGTTACIHPNEKRQNEMGIQVYISCHIQIILFDLMTGKKVNKRAHFEKLFSVKENSFCL